MNTKPKPDIYISVDIETTGDVPPINSMISLGAVAFKRDGALLDTFKVNIAPLPESVMDPFTQRFWDANPEAYRATLQDVWSPEAAMASFDHWLSMIQRMQNNRHIVFVGYPAAFDFGFVKYYFKRFLGRQPFGFVALDLKTLGMAILNSPRFDHSRKGNFPAEWLSGGENHTHVALDDAIEQAKLAIEMFASLDQLHMEANVTKVFSRVSIGQVPTEEALRQKLEKEFEKVGQ